MPIKIIKGLVSPKVRCKYTKQNKNRNAYSIDQQKASMRDCNGIVIE